MKAKKLRALMTDAIATALAQQQVSQRAPTLLTFELVTGLDTFPEILSFPIQDEQLWRTGTARFDLRKTPYRLIEKDAA